MVGQIRGGLTEPPSTACFLSDHAPSCGHSETEASEVRQPERADAQRPAPYLAWETLGRGRGMAESSLASQSWRFLASWEWGSQGLPDQGHPGGDLRNEP